MPAIPRHAAPPAPAEYPRGRAHIALLGVAAILLGLAIYQGVVVAFGAEPEVTVPESDTLLVDRPDPAPVTAPAPAGEVDVHVEITWRARLRPVPPPPACRVLVGDQEVAQPAIEWLAGSASTRLHAVRAGDAQLVRIAAHGQDTLRLVKVRDGGVLLRLGSRVRVHGSVVDTDGRGLGGARVWAAGAETTTAADGTFAVEAIGGADLPVVAVAKDMAAQSVVLDAWGDAAVRFVLQPGAQLKVRLLGTLPQHDEAPQVVVVPADEPRSSAEAQFPFFLQALAGGVPALDRGVATVTNLPIGARLRVCLAHPGVVADEMPVAEVRARPTEVNLLVARAVVVSGKVVDGEGRPLARAVVATWPEADGDALARGPASACALPALAYGGRGAIVHTAADGSFRAPRCQGTKGTAATERSGAARRATSRLVVVGTGAFAAEVLVHGTAPEVVHDLEVPGALAPLEAGGVGLTLVAGAPGHYRVHVQERGSPPRPPAPWTGAAPFTIGLRSPALADVKVSVGAAGSQRVRTLPSMAIVGSIAIDLPGEAR